MRHSKTSRHPRIKAVGAAVAAVVGGIALLVFSQRIKPAPAETATATQPATTAPATPASSGTPAPPGDAPSTPDRERAAAQNMSGLALLFSTMFFLLALIFLGWIIYDVRESRPAWKKQQKYPTRR